MGLADNITIGGGGGSTPSSPDYTGELVELAHFAGDGFGDGLTHYDDDENSTYAGGVLEIAQGSMVAIEIPEDVRAGVVGFMLAGEYGAIAPDSNDFLYAWMQLAAGTADLSGAGLMCSVRYRQGITMTGTAASPSPSSTSTASPHGLVQGAGDEFNAGSTLSVDGSLTRHSNASIYAATGATAPGWVGTATFTGWRAQDPEPSPERIVVWLRDAAGPVAGATIKFNAIQLVRRRGVWAL